MTCSHVSFRTLVHSKVPHKLAHSLCIYAASEMKGFSELNAYAAVHLHMLVTKKSYKSGVTAKRMPQWL